ELTGTARFRLEIAADGRVTGCAITGSTGHAALDTATCRLLEQRARFEPARNSNGDAVAGSFVNAVRWELPD
ncbi:MAG: energy transducer TonB, partial [Alphaproteobacteria bacterium]|nr:energy transducer TonB [Alphaproteobacteria bacterium]